MPVLHIEHAISDLDTWFAAFARLADRRLAAGVRRERVCQPVDDPRYILVDLDFDRVDQAQQFLQFLQEQVWAVPANSPALAGRPTGRILEIHHEGPLRELSGAGRALAVGGPDNSVPLR